MKAWDYAKTFFRSEKLHISYPKGEIGIKKCRKVSDLSSRIHHSSSRIHHLPLYIHNTETKRSINKQKKYALIQGSFFLLNDHTKCFIWGVNCRNTEAKRIIKKQKRCALMRWSFFLLNDHSRCLFWGVNNRNTEAKRNIKNEKDAPWCTDQFSYWMTTQGVYFAG